MKQHERRFETYKKNHRGENFEDIEKAKISMEKNQSKRLEEKAENLFKMASSNIENDNLIDEIERVSFESRKITKNSNTHKNRLKELQKNDDFI